MDDAQSDDGGALPQRTRRRRRRGRNAPADGGSCLSPTAVPADRSDASQAAVRPIQAAPLGNGYEYLDHTADVQLHSWGTSLPRAFEQAVVAMMAYMTDLELVEVREQRTFTAEGHDLKSLLYNFMDECLYVFCTEMHVCKQIEVESLELVPAPPGDRQSGDVGSDQGRAEDNSGAKRARARLRHSPNGCDGDETGSDHTAAAVGADQVWRIRARGVGERFEMGRHTQGTEVKAITYSAMQIFDRTHQTQAPTSSGKAVTADAGEAGGMGEHAAEIFVIVDI